MNKKNWKECSDTEKIKRLEEAIYYLFSAHANIVSHFGKHTKEIDGTMIDFESEKDVWCEKFCKITGQGYTK